MDRSLPPPGTTPRRRPHRAPPPPTDAPPSPPPRSAPTRSAPPVLQPAAGPDPGDENLVARFRAGDPAALSTVFQRYAPVVWSVAARVLHDGALADDAVQETFVRAWRASVRFDPSRPLGPWLFAIARRTAVDVRRREMRPTRGDHAPEGDDAWEDDGTDELWLRWEIRRALDRLPERDRSLMRLLHLEGHTHAQAAHLLDLPVGTVKSRSYRAHRRLARMLAHLEPVPAAAP